MVHSLNYLLSHNMTMISGEVQCKKCEKVDKIEYDLEQKFKEIASFISENRFAMHDRAPSAWMNPNLPSCEVCGSCVKPVLSKKRSINWLFCWEACWGVVNFQSRSTFASIQRITVNLIILDMIQ
ncbi:hypothetical protein CRYUN_Cryun05aG0248700 [Craigia yunnanensis]